MGPKKVKNIDIYLEPLVEELQQLWDGVDDVYEGTTLEGQLGNCCGKGVGTSFDSPSTSKDGRPANWKVMASSSQSLSGRKRTSPDSERRAEQIRERIIHLELENKFLEERVKRLEQEARAGRLRIDELRIELRERTEERDKEHKSSVEKSHDIQELLRMNDSLLAQVRKLLDKKKAARAAKLESQP
ncbi:hypothetical protein R1sor_004005 [Riccia sorocarpa]|uniref:Uncharacterized protein n=1 Tax=Riccia sorocarpa TaxID=122646 RepID=A0ABD3H3A0_9MARC